MADRRATTWGIAALGLLPFFVDIGTLTTNASAFALRTPPPMGQAVHASFILVAILLGISWLRRPHLVPISAQHLPRNATRLTVAALVFLTAAFFNAAFIERAVATDRYLQTIIVVLPLFIAPRLDIDPYRAVQATLVFSSGGLLIMTAYITQNGGAGVLGSTDRFRINEAFPQILIYLPFLAVIALAGALAGTQQPKLLRLTAGASTVIFLGFNYSRTTIALIALAALGSGLFPAPGSGEHGRVARAIGGVLLATAVFVLSAGTVAGARFSSIDTGRGAIWGETIDRLGRSPMFGEGFVPRSDINLKPWDTHNQFLEFLLRGGIVGGTCAIAATYLLAMRLVRQQPADRGPESDLHRIALILLGAGLVGGMSNVYLTQLFPGVFVWFAVGLAHASISHVDEASRTASVTSSGVNTDAPNVAAKTATFSSSKGTP